MAHHATRASRHTLIAAPIASSFVTEAMFVANPDAPLTSAHHTTRTRPRTRRSPHVAPSRSHRLAHKPKAAVKTKATTTRVETPKVKPQATVTAQAMLKAHALAIARAAAKPHDAGGVWLQLRVCESNNDYAENSGNGYYGAYQFSLGSWSAVGYSGLPSNASPAVQDAAATKLLNRAGWHSWPACSDRLGLR
jgi:hypothetical protein